MSDLYPDGKVLVKHALRKALYCELEIGHTVTVHDVEIIKKRMHEIVEQDEPISQVIASTETAMEMCRNRHMTREAELLATSTSPISWPISAARPSITTWGPSCPAWAM